MCGKLEPFLPKTVYHKCALAATLNPYLPPVLLLRDYIQRSAEVNLMTGLTQLHLKWDTILAYPTVKCRGIRFGGAYHYDI